MKIENEYKPNTNQRLLIFSFSPFVFRAFTARFATKKKKPILIPKVTLSTLKHHFTIYPTSFLLFFTLH